MLLTSYEILYFYCQKLFENMDVDVSKFRYAEKATTIWKQISQFYLKLHKKFKKGWEIIFRGLPRICEHYRLYRSSVHKKLPPKIQFNIMCSVSAPATLLKMSRF